MNIGVVGLGKVGAAVAAGFSNVGFENCGGHEIWRNDVNPDKSVFTKQELAQNCQVIFICVPTPCKLNGQCDFSAVQQSIQELSECNAKGLIVIKSTVPPGTAKQLSACYKVKVASNPEFMRERFAKQDFFRPDRIVVGADDAEAEKQLRELYMPFNVAKVFTDTTTAELIKYLSNIFLVLKIAYGLEMKRFADLFGCDANDLLMGVGLDKRIQFSHLGYSQGKISFNSPCLPKDLLAFRTLLKENKTKSSFLDEIWKIGVEKKCQS